MPRQQYDVMGALNAGVQPYEIKKYLQEQNLQEELSTLSKLQRPNQNDFATEGRISAKSPAANGMSNNGTMQPAGITGMETTQEIQNSAAAPRTVTPLPILAAEQVAPDMAVALNNVATTAPEQVVQTGINPLGTATSGFIKEGLDIAPVKPRPGILSRAAHGVASTIQNTIINSGNLVMAATNRLGAGGLIGTEDEQADIYNQNIQTQQDFASQMPEAQGVAENIVDIGSHIAPYLAMGPMAAPAMIGSGIAEGGERSLAQGENVYQAAAKGAVSGLAAYGLAKLPMNAAGIAAAPTIGVMGRAANNALTTGQQYKQEVFDPKAIGTDLATMAAFRIIHAFQQPKQKNFNLYDVPAEAGDYDAMFESYKAAKGEHPVDPVDSNTLYDEMVRGVRQASGNTAVSKGQVHDAIESLRQAAADRVISEQGPVIKQDQIAGKQPIAEQQSAPAPIEPVIVREQETGKQFDIPTENQAPVETPTVKDSLTVQPEIPVHDAATQALIDKVKLALAAKNVTPAPAAEMQEDPFKLPDYNELMRKKSNLEQSIFNPGGEVKPAATVKMMENYTKVTEAIQKLPEYRNANGIDLNQNLIKGDTQNGSLPESVVPEKAVQPEKMPSVRATNEVKQPWEMAKTEFNNSLVETSEPISGSQAVKKQLVLPDGTKIAVSGNESPEALQKRIDGIHKLSVEQALSEGKPVPVEVLAEYPDLKGASNGEVQTEKEVTIAAVPDSQPSGVSGAPPANLPGGIYQTKVKNHNGEIVDMYGVRKQEQDAKGSNFGDTLHKTLEEATSAQQEQIISHAEKQTRLAKIAEKDAADKAAKETEQKSREDIDGFASDKPALQLTNIQKILDKTYTYKGTPIKSKDLIKQQIESGAVIEVEDVPDTAERARLEAYIKANRGRYPFGNTSHPDTIAFNKAAEALKGNGPQKSERRLMKPDGFFTKFNKTELDYAEFLIAKKNESVTVSKEAVSDGWSDLNSEVGLEASTETLPALEPANESDGKLSRIEKIRKGIYVPERLPQNYDRAESGSALETATRDVRRVQESVFGREISGDSAWERGLRHKELADSEIKPKEAEALKAWAVKNDKLIEPSYIESLKPVEGKGGAEHNVFFLEDGKTVLKVNRLSFHNTYLEFFHRLAVHNSEFPDTAYNLEGFTERDGQLLPVVSQPWIRGRKATFQESHDNLIKRGFEPMGTDEHPTNYRIPETNLIIRDAHGDNTRIDNEGYPFVIDPVIEHDRETKAERLAAELEAENKPAALTPEESLYKLALDAHAHISMSPTRAATSIRDGMTGAAIELKDKLDKIAQTDEQKAVVDSQITQFKHNYVQNMKPILSALSRQVSAMVAGGSQFAKNHNSRNEKARSTEQKANADFNKWINSAKSEAESAVLAARTPEQIESDNQAVKDKEQSKVAGKRAKEIAIIKHFMALKVGDILDIGNPSGNPAIAKKNKKSVETTGGAKWTIQELYGINSAYADELMAEISSTEKPEEVVPEKVVEPAAETIAPPEIARTPVTIQDGKYDFDTHKEIQSRIIDGDITPTEIKEAFEAFAMNKDVVKEELLKRYDAKTLKKMERGFYSGKTKGESVSNIIGQIESDFILGNGVSYSPFSGEKHIDAVRKLVDKYTEADIAAYAEKMAVARAERAERIAQAKEALVNPQTLEDYRYLMQVKKAQGVEPLLTPEQQIKYDDLVALDNKARGIVTQERKAVVRPTGGAVESEIVETVHTRDKYPLFVVKAAERVDAETYKAWNATAKKLGGWYSKYTKDGAVPGFQFKSRESAEAFQAYVKGDAVTATETIKSVMADRAEEKQAKRADKLRTTAEKLEEDANGELNRDRLANTNKRAAQASAADDTARKNIALAKTMLNLADAIDSGEAVHLDGVWAKAHVETLQSILGNAKIRNLQENGASGWSVSPERHREPNESDMEFVRYPFPSLHADHLRELVRELSNRAGAKRDAEWLEKVIKANEKDSIVTLNRADSIERFNGLLSKAKSVAKLKYNVENNLDRMKNYNRLQVMKIKDLPSLRASLREFTTFKEAKKAGDKAKELERSLVGNKSIGIDFFPTPTETAKQMVKMAGVKPGMKVLEPSAGNGNIAEQLRNAGGEVDTVEMSSSLREILDAKGFNNVAHDFMDYNPGPIYDAIVMNPPFGNGADMDHVQHAYAMLKPGGKLIAIAGEGAFFRGGNKEVAFRDWLEESGASVEKLPEGTFTDRKLMNTTSVNARMIELEKPGAADVPNVQTVTLSETVAEETLLQYQLLREFNGRWQYKTKLGSTWLTANRKEDAVERAAHTYETAPKEDLLTPEEKGFTLTEGKAGDFTLDRGNLSVKVASLGDGKYQASWGSATSSPHMDKQTAIDWADNLRAESERASKTVPVAEPATRTTSKPGTVDRRTLEENRMRLGREVSEKRGELKDLESRYRRSSKAKSKDEVMDMIKVVTAELRPKEAQLRELDKEHALTMLEDSAEVFRDKYPIEYKATQMALAGGHGKIEAQDFLRTEAEKIAKGLLGDSEVIEITPTTFDMQVNATTRAIDTGGYGPGQHDFKTSVGFSLKYKVTEAIKALGTSNGNSGEYGSRANELWSDNNPQQSIADMAELHKEIVKEQELFQSEFEEQMKELYDAPQQDYVIATLRPALTVDDIKTVADVVTAFKDGILAYERGYRDSINYADIEKKEKLDQALQEKLLDKEAKFTVGKDKITVTVKGEAISEEQKAENAQKADEKLNSAAEQEKLAERWGYEGFTPEELQQRELSSDTPEGAGLLTKERNKAISVAKQHAETLRTQAQELLTAKNSDTKFIFWFNEEDPMKRAGQAGGSYLYGVFGKTEDALLNARRAMRELSKMDKVFAANPMLNVAVKEYDDGSRELRLEWVNGKMKFSLLPSAFGFQQDSKRLLLQPAAGREDIAPVILKSGDTIRFPPGYIVGKSDKVFITNKKKFDQQPERKVLYSSNVLSQPGGRKYEELLSPSDNRYPISKHELLESLSGAYGMEIKPGQVDFLDRGRTGQFTEVAGVFGHEVVFYKITDGSLRDLGGYFDTGLPRIIFIDSRTGSPFSILGHELGHAIKENAPELFAELEDLPKNDPLFDWYTKEYTAEEGEHSQEHVSDEFISDFIRQGFEKRAFWDSLAKQNPSLFEKIAAIAKALIDKVKTFFAKHGFEQRETNHQFFNDMKKAENILLNIMDRYAAKQKKSRNEVFSEGVKKATSFFTAKLKDNRGLVGTDIDSYRNVTRETWEKVAKETGISIAEAKELLGYSEPVAEPIFVAEEPIIDLQESDMISSAGFRTSTKNAVVEEERATRGIEPVLQHMKYTDPVMYEDGARLFNSDAFDGRSLATELIKRPRPINAAEQMALLFDRVKIRNEFDATNELMIEANAQKDAVRIIELQQRLARLHDEFDANERAARIAGTEWSAAGRARQLLMAEDYSYIRVMNRARAASGKNEVPPEVVARIEELTQKLAEASKKATEYEEKIAKLEADKWVRREVKATDQPNRAQKRATARREVDADFKNLANTFKHMMGRLHSIGLSTDEAIVLAQMAKNRVIAGIHSAEEIVNDIYDELSGAIPELEHRDIRDAISGYGKSFKMSQDEIAKELRDIKAQMRLVSAYEDAKSGEMPLRTGLQRDPVSDEVRDLQKQVKQAMRESGIANLDGRSAEDQWKSSLDAIKTRLKNQIHDLAKQLETGEKTPRKIGVEYDQEAKALKAEADKLREALEAIEGKPEMSPEQRLKLAMAAVEKNITELERQITAKDVEPVKAESKTPLTPELAELRSKRDKLRIERDDLRKLFKDMKAPGVPDEDPEISRLNDFIAKTERQIAAAEKTTQRSIETYEQRISDSNLEPKRKVSSTPSTPGLAALRERREALKATFKAMQKAARPQISPEERYLKIFKARMAKRKLDLQNKLDTGDFEKTPKKSYRLDPEAQALKAEVGKIKNQVEIEITKLRLANRTRLEKGLDWSYKIRRAVILSGVGTLEKLTAAATMRSFITNPIEEAIGTVLRMIPVLSDISAQAPREGGGLSVRAEAAAFKQWFMKETWKDTYEVIKTGRGMLDNLYGHHNDGMPPEWIEFFGRVHGALKNPAKRAEFSRALQKRSEWAIRNNMDLSEPDVMAAVTGGAYIDSLRAILMDDNAAVQAYRMVLRFFESKGSAGQIFATGIELGIPIVKIPTNFAAEVGLHIGGAGYAGYKILETAKEQNKPLKEALKNIPPDDADKIMRAIKKNIVGMVLLAVGASLAEYIGGFWQSGESRSADEPKAHEIKIGETVIGKHLQHQPQMETLQAGATAKRVYDSYKEATKKGRDEDGRRSRDIYNGEGKPGAEQASLMAVINGVLKSVPFIETPKRAFDALENPTTTNSFLSQQFESLITPPDVRKIAKKMDTFGEVLVPRQKDSLKHVLMGSVPGQRKNIPINDKAVARMPAYDLLKLSEEAPQEVQDELQKILRNHPTKRREVNRARNGMSAE